MRFRTKPVEVEAIKVDDVLDVERNEDQDGWDALPEWFKKRAGTPGISGDIVVSPDHVFIQTPGLAKRRGDHGDWLVYQGGDIYVFKPQIFEQLYEPVR